MKTKITLFVFLMLVFHAGVLAMAASPSSPTLTISTIDGATPGPVVLPVHATDIVNMGSFQFTVEYDATKLTYTGASGWYSGITSVTILESVPGHISFLWVATAGGINIPDGTFFNILFNYNTGSSPVIWSDNPTPREFTDWDGNTFIPVYHDGAINGTGNVPVLSVTPSNQNVTSPAGTTSFSVSNVGAGTMSYTALVTSGADWLTITGGGSGGNQGTIDVSYTQNTTATQRIGSITVTAPDAVGSPVSVTVTQASSTPGLPTVSISTISVFAPGPVVVPVHASNIVNMGSFQFTIEYDVTKLTYTGTSGWYTGITSVTSGETSPGHVAFVWAGDTGGINIPDGTFFNINFNYLTDSSPVIWSDNPTPREFGDWNGNIFVPTYVDGAVNGGGTPPILNVTPLNQDVTFSQGTTSFSVSNTGGSSMTYSSQVTSGSDWLTITGGGSGGNEGVINASFTQNPATEQRIGTITVTAPGATGSPVQVTVTQAPAPPSQPVLNINTIDVSAPGPVLVPVHATDIVNMGAFQFTIEYDATKLTYTGTSGWYTGINSVTSSETSPGHIAFVWAGDTGGINIPDGTFFNLNFNYISDSSTVVWSDDPTPREFATWDGNIFIPAYIDGAVNGDGTLPVLSVAPQNQDVPASAGTTSFSVSNAGTGTMNYISEVTSGSDWLTITGGGSGGNSGTIELFFAENLTTIQRIGTVTVTAAGATGSPVQVTVTQAAAAPAIPVLTINTIIVSSPGPVELPVHATDIVNMGAFQFTIEYDVTKMTYTGTSGWYTGITSVTSGETTPGHVAFVWAGDTQGIDIPDGTFFNLNFSYISDSSAVVWSDNPTPREFADFNGNIFVPAYIDGAVNGDGMMPVLSVTPPNQDVSNLAGTRAFAVSNTGSGTMSYSAEITTGSDWLTITGGGSGGNEGTIAVSFTQNPEGAQRIGTITVTAPGASGSPVQVTVTQAPAPPAQPVLTISTIVVSAPGPVEVPVHATDIVNMGAFQFTIEYDATKMTYTGASGWYAGITSVTIGETTPGHVAFVWAGDTGGIDIADGTFFNLDFDYISDSSAVTWSDNPTPREFARWDGTIFVPDYVNGAVNSDGTQPELSVSPSNQDVPATAGTTSFAVSNTGTGTMNYAAEVTAGSDWLTITGGGSGGNEGTINVAFTQNPESTQRIGIITITASGATGSPVQVTVTQAGDIHPTTDDLFLSDNIKIFPNPARCILKISSDISLIRNSKIEISNILGEVVYHTETCNSDQVQIDVSGWKQGLYGVNIQTEKGTLTKRFVIIR